jgi:signal transduction histidine kinase/DNA-binding response OmpR family regulator
MQKRSVLIIDDDAVDVEIIERYLPTDRFEVLAARSGPEGLSILDANALIDSVIIDIRFEKQDLQGLEILARIRERSELDHISAIILTAHKNTRDASGALRHGADDYMDKGELKDLASRVVIGIAKTRIQKLRRMLLTTLDREQILRQALEILEKLREPEVASLLLLCSGAEAYIVSDANLPSGVALAGCSELELFDKLRGGRSLFVQNSEAARLHPQNLAVLCLLAVPLLSDRQLPNGALCLFSAQPDGIDTEWVAPMTELADLVAIGLEVSSKAEELASERAKVAQEAERQSWSHVPLLLGELRHRIATPCNVVLNHIESLVSKEFQDSDVEHLRPELRSEISRRLGIIRRNADSVRKECDYITTFADQRPIEKSSFDVVSMLDDCLQEIRPDLERNHVDSEFDRGGHIALSVIGDEDQIKYGVQCILNNALEAILEKRRQSLDPATLESSADRVLISLKPNEQEGAVFRIADTGIGIPAENRMRLFQPLFTTKQRQRPGGFGLFGVKRVFRAHGGDVLLTESRPDRGTTFELSIPFHGNGASS